MTADDRQLLIATHKGHGPSATELWGRFSPRMIAYARAIVRDHEAAADIVQTVFLQVLKCPRERIRSISDVAGWLVSLTRNAALNHIRTARRDRLRIRRLGGTGPGARAAHGDLEAALAAIPRRDREILVLKHVAGLTFDQISIALGMNRNTAAARYRSALSRLRESLEHDARQLEGVSS
jgi:RNA polymerase sigma-70 factor (ECF subfamily)